MIQAYLQMGMDSFELLLSLCRLPVGLAQLDLHLIQISFHLLFQPESLVSAANLSLQGSLQSFYHPLVVALGLLHFFVFLGQLPLNVGLHLVELELSPENLALLVLQGTLTKKRHFFLPMNYTFLQTKVSAVSK